MSGQSWWMQRIRLPPTSATTVIVGWFGSSFFASAAMLLTADQIAALSPSL
jgi:hypothetical protein